MRKVKARESGNTHIQVMNDTKKVFESFFIDKDAMEFCQV